MAKLYRDVVLNSVVVVTDHSSAHDQMPKLAAAVDTKCAF